MRANPENRLKVMRLFHILRGVFKGAFTHKNFSILFDWFYPDYFAIIKKCLNAYIQEPCDDDVVILILKFVGDLVDNSSNRLRFDTWSINGLIVYKEGATLVIQFLELFNCLSTKPVRHGDKYKEQLRFLKVVIHFLEKCVSGNFINFAICEYYNDNTFTQLCQLTLKAILNQDLQEIKHFRKLNLKVYQLLEEFFKKHLELMFLRFDFALLVELLDKILFPAMREDSFELKSCALITMDYINEFIFNNLKKPSKKQP